MSEQFTIEIPDTQAKFMRQLAELTMQSVEEILVEAIFHPLPPQVSIDEQLRDLTNYTDAQLWAIVLRGLLPPEQDALMLSLIQKDKADMITESERVELDELAILYDKIVLLRTNALVELQERDYPVQDYLKQNRPQL